MIRIRICNLYGSGPGSGSFHQKAKKLRKTCLLSLNTDLNVPTVSTIKQKNYPRIHNTTLADQPYFLLASSSHWRKEQDPDPQSNGSGCVPKPPRSGTMASAYGNDSVTRFFASGFFSWINFPPAPEYPNRTVSNFFENSLRYSQVKVYHRYQRHHSKFCHQFR